MTSPKPDTKKCETFDCTNPGVRYYTIAPGTNVWLCEECIKANENSWIIEKCQAT